ncbi:hypothetical protein LIER_14317 [Lithospermum erythrorhizon]|uniref:Uncharacterized protein n=1 Tax=Lithospermum erythrorhizon TaxID=34254 RepID=A0AAV3Q2X6_LITER
MLALTTLDCGGRREDDATRAGVCEEGALVVKEMARKGSEDLLPAKTATEEETWGTIQRRCYSHDPQDGSWSYLTSWRDEKRKLIRRWWKGVVTNSLYLPENEGSQN